MKMFFQCFCNRNEERHSNTVNKKAKNLDDTLKVTEVPEEEYHIETAVNRHLYRQSSLKLKGFNTKIYNKCDNPLLCGPHL